MSKPDEHSGPAFLQWIMTQAEPLGITSQVDLATAAGVSESTITRFKDPVRGPRLASIVKIADALGMSMAQVGSGLDHARGGEPTADRWAWPDLVDAITHAPDITDEDERKQILSFVATLRAQWKADHESD